MEGGGWRVEGGGWRVEGGGWRVEGGGWRGATKWRVTAELCIFQGEMVHKEAPLHSNCHKT